MTRILNSAEISDQVDLPGGGAIVLIDRLGKDDQCDKEDLARNVFRTDAAGLVQWQVRSKFDSEGNPFTAIHREGDIVTAYRWDGGCYVLDLESGIATPLELER